MAFLSMEAIVLTVVIVLLIACSAFISGSEVAFFSLKGEKLEILREEQHPTSVKVLELMEKPRLLLATILITNNMVNISVIILFTILTDLVIGFQDNAILAFLVEVVVVAFALVLFGEVIPKVYASHQSLKFAKKMSYPIYLLRGMVYPLASFMVKHSSAFEKRIEQNKRSEVSSKELKEAIEITSGESASSEENKILKGLVNFGNITVRQIMRPRMDVVTVSKSATYSELLKLIRNNPFSRIPVFEDSFDKVVGILYIKDLLPHLNEVNNTFVWNALLRQPYFVPENKKIDDLLKNFQEMRVHMAVVVDEYGGTSGIVTLEDVLEEIVGEIGDEFDEDEIFHYKLDDKTFVFDGKTPLNDVVRIAELDDEFFEEMKGDAETLGGLLLEIEGQIPGTGKVFEMNPIQIKVEAADKKRVRRVRISYIENIKQTNKSGKTGKTNKTGKKS